MCGRLNQYTGLYEFVSVLSLPNMLGDPIDDQLACKDIAPPGA